MASINGTPSNIASNQMDAPQRTTGCTWLATHSALRIYAVLYIDCIIVIDILLYYWFCVEPAFSCLL